MGQEVVDSGAPGAPGQFLGGPGRLDVAASRAAADLEDSGAQLSENVAQCVAFLIVRHRGRNLDAENLLALVGEVPDAEAQRAGQDSLADFRFHGLDFLGGSLPLLGSLAHHVPPHAGVADERPHVDAPAASDGVQVLRNGLPSKVDPGPLRLQRDSFHFVEHFQVPLAVSGTDRSDDRAALADDDRSVAVEGGRVHDGVPHALGIEVGMVIDKARGDDPAVGVDYAGGGLVEPSHPHDLAAAHRDVGPELGTPGPVYHPSVLYE